MNSNLLLNKIHLIQIEYKKLLVSLLPKFKSGYAPETLVYRIIINCYKLH